MKKKIVIAIRRRTLLYTERKR